MRKWLVLAAVVLIVGLVAFPPKKRSTPWKPRLVILVAVDTLRADHLGAFGYTRPTSPNIDRVIRGGTLFTHAYSQSNESLFSYASIFTSSYPRQVSPLSHVGFRVPQSATTLASTLQSYGVRTTAFVAGGQLDHQFGFSRGFDAYEDKPAFGSFFHTFPRAFTWMKNRADAPAFLFLHGYDLHEPYHKPMFFDQLFDRGYRGPADQIAATVGGIDRVYHDRWYKDLPDDAMTREVLRSADVADPLDVVAELEKRGQQSQPLAGADVAHLTAAYDGALVYADAWVGLLVAQLRREGLLDETLLVLIGDHGEELDERGFFGHRVTLTEATTHVPLVLWAPGHVPAGARIDQVVELRSVAPTILSYLNVPGSGTSLRPVIEGGLPVGDGAAVSEALVPQACIRTARHRLVYLGSPGHEDDVIAAIQNAPLDARHFALFDLEADPTERANLLDKAPSADEAAHLRSMLVERLKAR